MLMSSAIINHNHVRVSSASIYVSACPYIESYVNDNCRSARLSSNRTSNDEKSRLSSWLLSSPPLPSCICCCSFRRLLTLLDG
jgi:hypothetical protein